MVGSGSVVGETSLKKAIRDGVLINETSILCKVLVKDVANFPPLDIYPRSNKQDSKNFAISGPLIAIPCRTLDLTLWSIGGAQLVLCLVSLAEVSASTCRLLRLPFNGDRHPTNCPGQLPSFVTVSVIVGKIRRTWNESVRRTFYFHVRC